MPIQCELSIKINQISARIITVNNFLKIYVEIIITAFIKNIISNICPIYLSDSLSFTALNIPMLPIPILDTVYTKGLYFQIGTLIY